jgi:hypothetical protein
MTTDVVICIVPFMERVHFVPGDFSDYWRFTPFALERLFAKHNFSAVILEGTDIPGSSLYYLCVFSCHPEKYLGIFGPPKPIAEVPDGSDMYTSERIRNSVKFLIGKRLTTFVRSLRRSLHPGISEDRLRV